MIIILAKCIVKENSIDEFISCANELVSESRKEKGCISYELCQDLKDKNKFVFVEKWKDQDAIDAHNNSNHFNDIVPNLAQLQECDSEVNLYDIK